MVDNARAFIHVADVFKSQVIAIGIQTTATETEIQIIRVNLVRTVQHQCTAPAHNADLGESLDFFVGIGLLIQNNRTVADF
ncbi:Uncharacterised protein [Neisseria meningitidis]|nr:Uncharacterised protein [Neisseria meningitidis]